MTSNSKVKTLKIDPLHEWFLVSDCCLTLFYFSAILWQEQVTFQ